MRNMPDSLAAAPRDVRPSRPARRSLASCRPAARSIEPVAADLFRFRIGEVQAAYRLFPTQSAISLVPTDREIHIVLPVRGAAAVVAGDTHNAGPGEALLLARAERLTCLWRPGSAGLMLRLPRAAVQAEAARLFEAPRRLAGVVSAFEWSDRPAILAGPPFDSRLLGTAGWQDEADECQRSLCASLVRAIAAGGLDTAAFPVAKSVWRALNHIRTHPQGAWTVEDLAPIAGVTPATLRRNFRACLGLTVTQVVRDARLDWVRRGLASPHESRSISQLAEAAGFSAANVLARAYQQCFGETPTQTRSRAFAGARD